MTWENQVYIYPPPVCRSLGSYESRCEWLLIPVNCRPTLKKKRYQKGRYQDIEHLLPWWTVASCHTNLTWWVKPVKRLTSGWIDPPLARICARIWVQRVQILQQVWTNHFTNIHTYVLLRVSNYPNPNMQVFGQWEEVRVQRVNWPKHRGQTCKLHIERPQPNHEPYCSANHCTTLPPPCCKNSTFECSLLWKIKLKLKNKCCKDLHVLTIFETKKKQVP